MQLKEVKSSKDEKYVIIILESDYIESVNKLYNAKVAYKKVGGKRQAYPLVYKSPEATKFVNSLNDQLDTINFREDHPWIFDSMYFDVTVQVVMNRGFNKRDLDNCLKMISDSLFGHALGLNDSRVVSWRSWKSFLPSSDKEYIMIKLEESSFNIRFDDIEGSKED